MISPALAEGIESCARQLWQARLGDADLARMLAMPEPGHALGQPVESETVAALASRFRTIRRPGRSIGDVWVTEAARAHPVNVKTGVWAGPRQGGSPNIVSLKRLIDELARGRIDAYYLLLVRFTQARPAPTVRVHLVDLFDHLDHVAFDAGPGQLMLRESRFYPALDAGWAPPTTTAEQRLDRLFAMYADGVQRLIANRLGDLERIEGLRNQLTLGF